MKRLNGLKFFFAFFMIWSTSAAAEISQEQRAETYKQLETLANVITILQTNYIEEVDPALAIEGAINGLLISLDPHSSFLKKEDLEELQEENRGSFSGIGIEVTFKNRSLMVISPIEGSPGDKAGLKPKDRIIKIDGVPTSEMTASQAITKIRGQKGSKVTLSVFREEWNELHDIEITRNIIPLQSVKGFFISPGLAYMRITSFQGRTTKDFKHKLIELGKKHKIKGLIMDLRNNPGGLLNQAVSISDLFLDQGLIVYTKGRTEKQNLTFQATDSDANNEFPLIVMVNEGSASASEIVAGALQDHKRAIIVGTRTFGKGSVQTIIPLPDGNGLKLTTAKYYTPSGQSIQEQGIKPNVEVKYREPVKVAKKSKIVREKDLPNHFTNPTTIKKDFDATQTLSEEMTGKLENDSQLYAAYNILKSLSLYKEFPTTEGK